MCGIAGVVDYQEPVQEELLHRMCAAMEHRGPDSRGVHVDGRVGLGIQRLAIIDKAGGDQPIFNEDGSIAVVMNGEIYNFQSLREDLLRRGHRFTTHVDTEVLVHLYEEYGKGLVHHLRGMFAFAIWDRSQRLLLCARDRVGKKPLFWAREGNRVWFASEVVPLLQDPRIRRDVNPMAISAYLALQYVPHPMSAFARLRKLPPASTLTVTEQGETIERYWSLDYTNEFQNVPEKELEERLRAVLWEATRLRLISDVPLGAFLSGGLDSSAVVASMAEQASEPVKTFSIGFGDEDYDEVHYARLVADHFATDHREFRVEPEALQILPKLARHYGEPYADASAIPSFYLAELTSRHVTVALNGDGGDESFAGYQRYAGNFLVRRLDWLPGPVQRAAPKLTSWIGDGPHDRSARSRVQRLARTLPMSPSERYSTWMSAFDPPAQERLLSPEFSAAVDDWSPHEVITGPWCGFTGQDRLDQMLHVDIETYLPADLLVKMDIATMAYSLEARSPFLDQEVMQFAASLPSDLKLRKRKGKRILKAALRGIVPDAVLDRPKMGFAVPLARWFREDLRDLPSEVLLDESTLARGYFRREEVDRLLREHQEGLRDHSVRIWALLQLEMWHREVVEAPSVPTGALPAT